MKVKFVQKVFSLSLVLFFAFWSFACQSAQTTSQETVKAPTPREAYRLLYEAVKAKNTPQIEQLMSNNTMTFAGFAAEKQKQSLEKVFENGLTATTFAASLPESRDERVNGNFGALEVYSQKDNRWEDIPFVLEDGSWKLAFGDTFKGDYKSPGKGQAQLEMEANNPAMRDQAPPAAANTNSANVMPKHEVMKNRVKKSIGDSIQVPDESANKQ